MVIDEDRKVAADLLEEHGFDDLAKELRSPKVILTTGKLVMFNVDGFIGKGFVRECEIQEPMPSVQIFENWDRNSFLVPRPADPPSIQIEIQFVGHSMASEGES